MTEARNRIVDALEASVRATAYQLAAGLALKPFADEAAAAVRTILEEFVDGLLSGESGQMAALRVERAMSRLSPNAQEFTQEARKPQAVVDAEEAIQRALNSLVEANLDGDPYEIEQANLHLRDARLDLQRAQAEARG